MRIVVHYANAGLRQLGLNCIDRLQPQSLTIDENPALSIYTSMPPERIEKLIAFIRCKSKPFLIERVPMLASESREVENSR